MKKFLLPLSVMFVLAITACNPNTTDTSTTKDGGVTVTTQNTVTGSETPTDAPVTTELPTEPSVTDTPTEPSVTEIPSNPTEVPSVSTTVETRDPNLRKVTFNVSIPSALESNQSITIAGTMNNWTPANTEWVLEKVTNTTYTLTKEFDVTDVPTDDTSGRCAYKYTIQTPGMTNPWDLVEKASDGSEIEDRVINLNSFEYETTVNDTVAKWDVAGN